MEIRYPIISSVFAVILCLTLAGCETNYRSSKQPYQNPYAVSKRDDQNQHIALLLPTQGSHAPAAKTIRDGLLAAYYQAKQNQSAEHPLPSVKVYDTSSQSVEAAYQQALAENASIIVGPLTKPEVQAIAKLPLEIPVLALNTISEENSFSRNLYQFGLMPEDEVVATAEQALKHGHQYALILAPQSEWGQRLADTFRQFWISRHATVVDIKFFKSVAELDSTIRSLLQVQGTTRRTDADMIFIAANNAVALQIKPLLNAYYAEALPVYATASVYTGMPSPHTDQDLNGIHFCDMPWILRQSAEMQERQKTLQTVWPHSQESPRFFALGLDAYQLAMQLGIDQKFASRHTAGFTGELQINNYQRIQRGLVCARFEQGIPVAD